jgi:Zn-dependent M16 (insulinase) family peptidase
MGSKNYPFKGIIDQFANRGFSDGTNAWTDVDHTCYTVFTAGSQGFMQILPIYIDHIINPTMTQAAFITEVWILLDVLVQWETDAPHWKVHHISPNGQNSGVVYSEMQGRESTAADRMDLGYG